MSKRKLNSDDPITDSVPQFKMTSFIYNGYRSSSMPNDDEMVVNDMDPLVMRRPAELAALYRQRDEKIRQFNLMAVKSLQIKCTRPDNVQYPLIYNHRCIKQSKLCMCSSPECTQHREQYDLFVNRAIKDYLKPDNDPCWLQPDNASSLLQPNMPIDD